MRWLGGNRGTEPAQQRFNDEWRPKALARVWAGCMPKKILVVEDSSELLQLLSLNLKEAGFSVATASNGIAALKKVRSACPDLVVLDLVLPELDGFAVCETLRLEASSRELPVIILTGLNSELTRLAGLECGANEYVKKPVSPQHLVSRIKHWLEASAASRSMVEGTVGKNSP